MGHGFNISCRFIELMAKLGLAYDLKATSQLVVEAAKEKVAREQGSLCREDSVLKKPVSK